MKKRKFFKNIVKISWILLFFYTILKNLNFFWPKFLQFFFFKSLFWVNADRNNILHTLLVKHYNDLLERQRWKYGSLQLWKCVLEQDLENLPEVCTLFVQCGGVILLGIGPTPKKTPLFPIPPHPYPNRGGVGWGHKFFLKPGLKWNQKWADGRSLCSES